MKGFFTVFSLSFRNLGKNWYILLFSILTVIPVLFCIFIRINPVLVVSKNPVGEVQKRSAEVTPGLPGKNSDDSHSHSPNTEAEKEMIPMIQKKWEGKKTSTVTYNQLFAIVSQRFLLGFIVLLALACLGSRAIGEEVEMGTLQMLFLRPIHRCTIYVAHFVALIAWGLLLSIPALILIYCIFFFDKWQSLPLLYTMGIYLLGVLPYSALFLLIGMFRGGIYFNLGYACFWEMLIGIVAERAGTLSFSYYLLCLTLNLLVPEQKWDKMASPSHSVLILLLSTLILLSIGWIVFRKKQFLFS